MGVVDDTEVARPQDAERGDSCADVDEKCASEQPRRRTLSKRPSRRQATASYDAEASEVSDDTPVLAQPTITTAMGRAFVPFSIEVGMDWGGIEQELAQLISDGRDVLDAVQFHSGTGVKTGLSTSQRVLTDVAATLDIDDVYDVKGQLPGPGRSRTRSSRCIPTRRTRSSA